MKQLFFCLSIFMLFTACKNNIENPSADVEIKKKINQLYAYDKSDSIYRISPVPADLFSHHLEKLLKQAIDLTKANVEKAKKNNETPKFYLSGSILTSMPEGFTSYKIKAIEVAEGRNVNEANADVTVDFESTKVSPAKKWTDKIQLTNAFSKGWKIDNIEFSSKIGDLKSDLKTVLSEAKSN